MPFRCPTNLWIATLHGGLWTVDHREITIGEHVFDSKRRAACRAMNPGPVSTVASAGPARILVAAAQDRSIPPTPQERVFSP